MNFTDSLPLLNQEFLMFGTAHLLAILVTFLTAAGLTVLARKHSGNAREKKPLKLLRYTMAVLLVTAVSLDPVLTLVRDGTGPYGWDRVVGYSLPLYLCDVVSILLAYALVTCNQRITEVGYCWGLAGTVQGLITPTLGLDATTPEFYVFFLQHGGVPIAAIFLVWGMRIIPEKGAFKRVVFWSWGYMAVVMTINWIIGRNYGFLNSLEHAPVQFEYMGPYPFTLITLQAIAFTLYFILLKIAPKKTS